MAGNLNVVHRQQFTSPHEISLFLLLLPQPVLENPVYKVEDLGGTSWKMTILNIRSLASLATIMHANPTVDLIPPQKLFFCTKKHFFYQKKKKHQLC